MTDVLSQPLSDAAFAEEEEEIRRLEQEIADAEKRAQEEELKARQYAAEAQAAEDEVRAVSGYVDLAASTEFGDEPNESLLHSANATGTINSPRDNSVSSAGDALPALNLIDVEIPTMPAELAHIQKAVDAEVAAAFTMAPPQELVTIVTPPAKESIVNETSAVKPSSVPSLSVEPIVQASRPVSAPLDQFVDAPSAEATITVVTEPTKQEPAPVPPRSSSVSSAGPELASVAEEPAGQDPALLEQVAQLQSRYSELERKHKALETLHEESQDLEKELEAHVQLLEREAQENREELKARMKELAEVQARARDIAAERADIERRLQDTEVLLDKMVQHQQESKSKFEKKLADLQVSFDSANKRLQQADSEITHLQREIQKLSTDQVVLKQEIRHLEAENDKLQKKNRIERGYHEAFEKKYNDAEERIVLLQQEMIEIQTEKAEIVRRLNEEIPHEEHRIKSDKAPNFSLIEEHIQQLTVEQRAALLRKFTVEELAAVGAHIPAAGTIPTVSEAVASRPLARQGTLTRMGTLVPPISGLPGLLRTSSIGSRNSTVGVPGVDRPYESQPAFVPSPRRTSSFMSPRDVLESATASAAAVKAAAGPQSASHVMPLPKNSLLETGLQITDASGRPVARVVEDKYSGLVIQPLSAVMEGGAPASARAGGGEETEAQGGISGSNDASYVSRNRASTVTLPVDYERSELEEDPHRGRPSVSNTESLRLIDDRYQAYPAAEKGQNKRGCCSVGACGGRPTANSVDGGCVIS